LEKITYRIGELAKKLGIHEQTIRMYERKHLIKPHRLENTIRIFNENDLTKITNIITMTQELGMNLVGVKMVFALAKKMKMNDEDLWDFIQDHKGFLNR